MGAIVTDQRKVIAVVDSIKGQVTLTCSAARFLAFSSARLDRLGPRSRDERTVVGGG